MGIGNLVGMSRENCLLLLCRHHLVQVDATVNHATYEEARQEERDRVRCEGLVELLNGQGGHPGPQVPSGNDVP